MVTAKTRAPSGEGLHPLLAHFEASEWALLKVKTVHTRASVSVCLSAEEGGGEQRLPRIFLWLLGRLRRKNFMHHKSSQDHCNK